MNQEVLNQEKSHLAKVLSKLRGAKDVLERSLDTVGKTNLEKLKDLRENPETSGADFHFFLDQLQQENLTFNIKDKYKRLDEFNLLVNEPYFARIDLKDSNLNTTQELYIGKFGYTENEPVVIDWRAKIASVYYRYRYPQKNVSYNTPLGKEEKDLLLKRTFEIDDTSLVKYYNNDLQLDESEIISEKIEHRTGGVLEDIVETIQISQLDIIEADPRQICIVQGCVGSGKSTVAIHKLSHIFFNYPKLIKPERCILIAKNQILVGYLSTLFPKLGIFDVNYKTIRELLFQLIFREELNLSVDFDLNNDVSRFTLSDMRKLQNGIDKIHEEYARKIKQVLDKDEYEGFASFKYSKNQAVYENISDIVSELEEELELQKEAIKESPKSIRALLHKENIKTIKKMLGETKKLRAGLKTTTMAKFLKDLSISRKEKLGYLQTLIYIYTYFELVGLRAYKKYEYCVVDEGQDFNTLEYAVLGKLVLHGRFSILGDLNQANKEEGIVGWSEIAEVVKEARQAHTFTLDTNYRSTKPIIDLANKILGPYTKDYLPKSINRKGPEPEIVNFSTKEKMLDHFGNVFAEDLSPLEKSIGVICFDIETFNRAKEVISKQDFDKTRFIELEEHSRITYIPKGIYLTMFENSKGLEFAKVYVLDLNLDRISNFKQAKEAFVATTRAMNELHVYSA
ncbi:UvrD-helicase domain-containing protein [Patescibacteria group bacterium]